ncbi:MAG: glycosyltransferase family 2 protein [Mangrovicoccus sp.]
MRISVVVVSHGRPEMLSLCLQALHQQRRVTFELIIVGDRAAQQVVRQMTWLGPIKFREFDQRNVSRARNLGISMAAGEVIAFIDDDAMALPDWLHHLTDPFRNPDLCFATGAVRGADGIRWQSRGEMIDSSCQTQPLEPSSPDWVMVQGRSDTGLLPIGTNSAFRAAPLRQVGGFDEAYAYYLDDADLGMRLAKTGALGAYCPKAEVFHAQAAGPYRDTSRAPRDLFQIGHSSRRFFEQHSVGCAEKSIWYGIHCLLRKRLSRHMVKGRLGPEEAAKLLAQFNQAWVKYSGGDLARPSALPEPNCNYIAFLRQPNNWHKSFIFKRKNFFLPWRYAPSKQPDSPSSFVLEVKIMPFLRRKRMGFHQSGVWFIHLPVPGLRPLASLIFGQIDLEQTVLRELRRIAPNSENFDNEAVVWLV